MFPTLCKISKISPFVRASRLSARSFRCRICCRKASISHFWQVLSRRSFCVLRCSYPPPRLMLAQVAQKESRGAKQDTIRHYSPYFFLFLLTIFERISGKTHVPSAYAATPYSEGQPCIKNSMQSINPAPSVQVAKKSTRTFSKNPPFLK